MASRINSTWGGNLTDAVRARRILEVIEDRDLATAAGQMGKWLLDRLQDLESTHDAVTNARGRGLMCALDFPTGEFRDEVNGLLRTEEHVLMLACGDRSLRFRPALTVTEDELAAACDALDRVLARV